MASVRIAATILACFAASAAGQSPSGPPPSPIAYAIKKCTPPKVPIGRLPNAAGTVSLLLGKDGKPDTSSIAVVQVAEISVSGFRSVVVRRLSSCQFEMGRSPPGAPAGIVLEVTTSDTGVLVSVATPTTTARPPLAPEPVALSLASFPLPLDDPRLEERPRRLRCGDPAPRLRTPQEIEEWFRTTMGSILTEVLVGPDGKPDHKVKLLWTSNPGATRNLVNWEVGCEFAPGRYRGMAVPAFLRDSLGLAMTKRP